MGSVCLSLVSLYICSFTSKVSFEVKSPLETRSIISKNSSRVYDWEERDAGKKGKMTIYSRWGVIQANQKPANVCDCTWPLLGLRSRGTLQLWASLRRRRTGRVCSGGRGTRGPAPPSGPARPWAAPGAPPAAKITLANTCKKTKHSILFVLPHVSVDHKLLSGA